MCIRDRAWYKLLHRDMGPVERYLGPWVPEAQIWQDPVPAVDHELVGEAEIAELKQKVLDTDLSLQQLVLAAWASASSFRRTDMRGGANGARIRLEPMRSWEANAGVGEVIEVLEQVRQDFNAGSGAQISLADLIVLAGCAAIEEAARDGGHDITVPFTPGRTDATEEQTDADTFAVLEPRADGFRSYLRAGEKLPAEWLLLDKANLLGLTAPEMTVLLAGMRALGANAGGTSHGVLTERRGALTNDVLVNLLEVGTEWKVSATDENVYEGRAAGSDEVRWTATAPDLVIGATSQLRAIAEVYAQDDAGEKFARDFVKAWDKVMNLDRFDLARG